MASVSSQAIEHWAFRVRVNFSFVKLLRWVCAETAVHGKCLRLQVIGLHFASTCKLWRLHLRLHLNWFSNFVERFCRGWCGSVAQARSDAFNLQSSHFAFDLQPLHFAWADCDRLRWDDSHFDLGRKLYLLKLCSVHSIFVIIRIRVIYSKDFVFCDAFASCDAPRLLKSN